MSEDVIEGVGEPVDDDMAAEMTAAAEDTCCKAACDGGDAVVTARVAVAGAKVTKCGV